MSDIPRLKFHACAACGTLANTDILICAQCLGSEMQNVEVPASGTLVSAPPYASRLCVSKPKAVTTSAYSIWTTAKGSVAVFWRLRATSRAREWWRQTLQPHPV